MIKKLWLVMFFAAIFTIDAVFGQSIVKQDLAGIATLDFPDAPSESIIGRGVGKMFKLDRPAQNYMAIIIPVTPAQASITSDQELDLFYSGVVEGATDSTQKRKLVYTKQIMVEKYKAVEFKYLEASTAGKFTVYQRIIYLDQTLLMYSFTIFDDTVKDINAEREQFLNSFKIIRSTAKQF